MKDHIISVFTKPWKNCTAEELAEHVLKLGFTAIEFPLRTGYQVEPQNAVKGFPKLVETMKDYGIAVTSVASDITEPIFEACGTAGVKLIRIMADIDLKVNYFRSELEWCRKLYNVLPYCEKYGVKVGIQQHSGAFIFTSMELRRLLEKLDQRYYGAIWDAAHSAIAYENPEVALNILWEYLVLVNFKNAYVKQISENPAKFYPYFTTAEKGVSDWQRAINCLLKKGYNDVICMPAEYSDTANVDTYIKEDLAYLKNIITSWSEET
ncbi:MAG: sugar phosphate isomerase/epimerase [Oscillospiraceae bacterium]|nr:sugar phosphate isomerase/epimerase [Oscillospiraceae bacterium]